MEVHLLIHNIGFAVSAILALGISFFIFFNNKYSTTNITLALGVFSVFIFIISHVVGVNIENPIISKDVLMFNMSNFLVGVFVVHSVLSYLGKAWSRRYIIGLLYFSAFSLIAYFIIHPDLFLLPSVPKMYFPNYYEPGILNWTRIAFLYNICISYLSIEIMMTYVKETNFIIQKKYLYLLFSILSAAIVGFIPNLLVYNIQIDPLFGAVLMIPFAAFFVYGSLKYELLDIRIVAKHAFIYSIGITIVGGLIMLFDYTNRIIQNLYPEFPIWIAPLISSIFIMIVAGSVWSKLRENEILKYEFITTVTHKFRTPLTHIKWASENLSQTINSIDDRAQLNYIQSANEKLVELTNILMNISETENIGYDYKLSKYSLSELVQEVADGLNEQYEIKKIKVIREIQSDLYSEFDESRIKFVVQTFIENAVHYTPELGVITISLKDVGSNITFSVTDSGIGIDQSELPRLFTKFYRGHKARLTDTEGMGIGLYMSKGILARHKGKIWASSNGQGKGSTFSFSLKKVKINKKK